MAIAFAQREQSGFPYTTTVTESPDRSSPARLTDGSSTLHMPYILRPHTFGRLASMLADRPHPVRAQRRARCKRSAFPTTETELKLIAAAAIIGLSKTPNHGYSTPAAIGMPRAL